MFRGPNLAANIVIGRVHAGWSPEQLAREIKLRDKRARVGARAITNWESAETGIEVNNLKLVARAFSDQLGLDITQGDLLGAYGALAAKIGIAPEAANAILVAHRPKLMAQLAPASSGEARIEGVNLYAGLRKRQIADLAKTRQEFNFTNLCADRIVPIEGDDEWRQALEKRLFERSIVVRRVEIFYNKERLKAAIQNAVRYRGLHYYLKIPKEHQAAGGAAARRPFPMLNVMSFDDAVFYLGGYHPDFGTVRETALRIAASEPAAAFLQDYFNLLWNWSEDFGDPLDAAAEPQLRRFAAAVAMPDAELTAVLAEARGVTP